MNIRNRIKKFPSDRVALISNGTNFSYGNILLGMDIYKKHRAGSLVPINGKADMMNICRLLSVIESGAIAIPMSEHRQSNLWNVPCKQYDELRRRGVPGLVLFTSGSSGKPKVAVHDARILTDKWMIWDDTDFVAKDPGRTMLMLGFDHIGGINTIFHVLFNGGTLVIPHSTDVNDVAHTIDKFSVNVLPTSPTFIKMMLLKSESEFPSLKMITYGTEPMPASTLEECSIRLPHVKLKQTYGLTECGILQTRSKEGISLMMKIKDEHRIVNGMLEIKHNGSFIGYINMDNVISSDGYYRTGDYVVSDGEWIRIVGRTSEFINVAGFKVHPSEIENDVLSIPGVNDCVVEGEQNPITGQIIKLTVNADQIGSQDIRRFLLEKKDYPKWKVPQRIIFTSENFINSRLKKTRCSHLKN